MQEFSFEWDNHHKHDQVYLSPYTEIWNVNFHSTPQVKPSDYNILLLKNIETPEDFITKTIEIFFNKTHKEAVKTTKEIVKNNQAICGHFPKDIAETIVQHIRRYCTLHNQHLKCATERRS